MTGTHPRSLQLPVTQLLQELQTRQVLGAESRLLPPGPYAGDVEWACQDAAESRRYTQNLTTLEGK